MEMLQLVAILLGQMALIARDPALGYRGAAITEALALLGTILVKGEAARAELEALASHIQMLVDQDREPTKDEWTNFRALSKRYHEILNPPPPLLPEEPAESTAQGEVDQPASRAGDNN